ncbi:MBL fold metallo-hydrolase [Streptomyces antnestii]|uniref:MBL fold metallo-hydrolase n=1 Tax=Streptomyces antnestii TaxID=2494256 RepID=UPI00294FF418|nr:MBL fold metallo-hydrolase [Streptomyces sp. San01]
MLTDGELDHTLGVARLREADRLELLATDAVRHAVLDRQHLGAVLAPYTELTWRELPSGGHGEPLGAQSAVHVSAVPVSGKRPCYAVEDGAAPGDDGHWARALRLTDRSTGGSAVYAPAFGVWSDALKEAVAEADCVRLETAERAVSEKPALRAVVSAAASGPVLLGAAAPSVRAAPPAGWARPGVLREMRRGGQFPA